MDASFRIAFVGGGNMATALIKGLVTRGGVAPGRITAADVSQAQLDRLSGQFGVNVTTDNAQAVRDADLVVLAVKPQVAMDVLRPLADVLNAGKLLVSIVAGLPTSRLAQALPRSPRIVRVMPNTPALVGAGAAAVAKGPGATDDDLESVLGVLRAVGSAVAVEEKLLDAVTGLSGSGPAYVFLIIEALSDAGVRMGLPRKTATELAAQTVAGSARMVLETGLHPGVLKDQVTSPGGTTIAGMYALEAGGVRAALYEAVEKATEKSAELGRR